MKRLSLLLIMLTVALVSTRAAQPFISFTPQPDAVPLPQGAITISNQDYEGVLLAVNNLRTDLKATIGARLSALEEIGLSHVETDVGDKYVYACMRENGYSLGGEQSGHIIFSKYANTGDGLLTAIKLMQAMLAQKRRLSELHADMVTYPQVLINVRVDDKQAALTDPDVQASKRAAEEKLGGEGRVLLRKSGTEPVLRVMSEALEHEACEKAVDDIIESMRTAGKLVRIK